MEEIKKQKIVSFAEFKEKFYSRKITNPRESMQQEHESASKFAPNKRIYEPSFNEKLVSDAIKKSFENK